MARQPPQYGRTAPTPVPVAGTGCGSTLDPVELRGRLAQAQQTCEQLQFALDSRVLIEQSKGVLIALYGCDASAAFLALRRAARNRGEKIHGVAELIVRAAQFGSRPVTDKEAATLDAVARAAQMLERPAG